MKDFLEQLEDSAERWYFENVKNGIAKCSCGNTFNIEEGETVSANPYAIPVCPKCFEEWLLNKK